VTANLLHDGAVDTLAEWDLGLSGAQIETGAIFRRPSLGNELMARLLSVNVGLPRDIAWQGKTVHTAVWKAPVEGPRMVRRLNIDGDGQGDLAGHGGEHRAVFVYQIDSYRYWQNQLSRKDFTYGQFGENFTVEGLPDAEVCIGDRYRIGGVRPRARARAKSRCCSRAPCALPEADGTRATPGVGRKLQ
jgi:hypothetical protein